MQNQLSCYLEIDKDCTIEGDSPISSRSAHSSSRSRSHSHASAGSIDSEEQKENNSTFANVASSFLNAKMGAAA
jgi:hypothetical protein